ncbi:MAG: DnaA ATPase domain-containing protein, partial [Candidatus Methylomirabilales bacterium]
MSGLAQAYPPASPQEIWSHALSLIQAQLAAPTFHSWFDSIRVARSEPDRLVLSVPSRFAKDWIEPRYLPLITRATARAAGRDITISLEVRHPDHLTPSPAGHPQPPSRTTSAPLNPRYTFDSFVIGASNRFAHAAAMAVSEALARAYNPLFIYGGVGLGKTHLLHAIGHYVAQTAAAASICYVSTEKFTNDFITAVGDPGRIAGFKRRYRDNDLLLVDDVQFLEH